MSKQTMLVKAIKVDGGYVLDADGCTDYSGLRTSRAACYKDAAALWPWSSTWEGHKVAGGYRITLS